MSTFKFKITSALFLLPLLAVIVSIATPANAQASSGSAEILSPADGATLSVSQKNTVEYKVALGKRGNHLHIWVDGEKGPSQKSLHGNYTLPKLTPGKHAIILKVVDKGHVPTGPEKSIFVSAE